MSASITNITIIIFIIYMGLMGAAALIFYRKRFWITYNIISPREIFFLDTEDERVLALRHGLIVFLKKWSTWVAFVISMIVMVYFDKLSKGLLVPLFQRASPLTLLLLTAAQKMLISPLCFLFFMGMFLRKSLRMSLRDYLNEHGIPICRSCGYDLRGQTNQRCPECGTVFNEKVSKQPSADGGC